MDRATREVILPISKDKVNIVEQWKTREVLEIQRKTQKKLSITIDPVTEKVTPTMRDLDSKEYTEIATNNIVLAITKVVGKDGTAKATGMDYVLDLDWEDYKFLEAEVNKIGTMAKKNLSQESTSTNQ